MMRRIIDKKRIDLTDDEWALYQEICKSYDRPNFKGTDLFMDLFETDENGIIKFLKPPKQYTSMEVFLFLINVSVHQHLRIMYDDVDAAIKDCKMVTDKASQLIEELKNSRAS